MTLDDWEIDTRQQLQECRAYQQRHEGARARIQPATWAQQAATVYTFVNLEAYGLTYGIDAMARVAEAPALLFVTSDRLQLYLERIVSLDLKIPTGCGLYSYDNILSTPAPTAAGLFIVENANELLDNLAKRNKTVEDFYQWSVGFYPLPNRHTHLVLQPH